MEAITSCVTFNTGLVAIRGTYSLGPGQGDVQEQARDAQVVLRERHRHPLHLEEVAEEHGEIFAPTVAEGAAFVVALVLRLLSAMACSAMCCLLNHI